MTGIEIIKNLCKERGISIARLEKELGYGNGSLAKSKAIKADRLKKIADYFGVSMELLLPDDKKVFAPHSEDISTAEIAFMIASHEELMELFKEAVKAPKSNILVACDLLKSLAARCNIYS